MDVNDQINTSHNRALLQANRQLANKVNELVEFQLKNPEGAKASSRADIDREKQIQITIERKKKEIRAQLALIKSLYRQSVLKVREEKAATSESRNINDTLILQLHNLKYEEQSLASEISAAQNYDHKYTKLPLIPVEDFLEQFPEHKEATEHDVMTARIEHEYQGRLKLEERRQEKLKQKQILIAEVKKRKDDLTKLDGMLEKFIEAADPIQKVLATE